MSCLVNVCLIQQLYSDATNIYPPSLISIDRDKCPGGRGTEGIVEFSRSCCNAISSKALNLSPLSVEESDSDSDSNTNDSNNKKWYKLSCFEE